MNPPKINKNSSTTTQVSTTSIVVIILFAFFAGSSSRAMRMKGGLDLIAVPHQGSSSEGPQDSCSDVLSNGVFNTFKSLNARNYKLKLRDAIAKSYESDSSDKEGGGIDVVVPIDGVPVPIGGKYEGDHVKALKEKYSHNLELELDESDLTWVEQHIASSEILGKWSKCMSEKNGQRGLKTELISVDDKTLVLKTWWVTNQNVSTVYVRDFIVSGAKCEPRIVIPRKMIGSETVSQPCVRTGREGVLVVLNVIEKNGRDAGSSLASSAGLTPPQNTDTETLVLLDNGESYADIGAAESRRGSWIRGGSNPIVGVNYRDYVIVKLPDNKFYNAMSVHHSIDEYSAIMKRWWAYSTDHYFKILTLEYPKNSPSPWTNRTLDGIPYLEYSGGYKRFLLN